MQNYKSKSKIIFAFLFAVFIFASLFLLWGRAVNKRPVSPLDAFAQCLTSKGAVMYGADWCPHCQNEKKAFGSSFKYVDYVECPQQPQRCIAARVNGYPTWIFAYGKRLEGEQGLEKLSTESGCPLPQY